ncbi:MAG: hypothetical protein N2450_06470 [bacterium]|nr:hypothetical protein [bacterium]
MMQILKLQFLNGLIFVEICGNLWFLDTGAPFTFGYRPHLDIDGRSFSVQPRQNDRIIDSLIRNHDARVVGFLGNNVINLLDFIFHLPKNFCIVSQKELQLEGQAVPITKRHGPYRLNVTIKERQFTTIFDTGAEINYIQDDIIREFEPMGRFDDFNPFLGHFHSETYRVEVWIGGILFPLRCGFLPEAGIRPFLRVGVQGVIGNAIMHHRVVGYFPRRNLLVLGEEC